MRRAGPSNHPPCPPRPLPLPLPRINDENPLAIASRTAQRHNFATPLDEVDAAARILDPVLGPLLEAEGREDATCAPAYGSFLKDYHPCEW